MEVTKIKHFLNLSMLKKIRSKNLVLKLSLVVLIVFVFSFSVALAEFARRTGDTGWGYGYGYGYGFGYGWDGGTIAGNRSGGEEAASEYGYGYGFGFLSADTAYDEDQDAYVSSPDDLTSLALSGVITVEGESSSEATALTFTDNVIVEFVNDTGDIQVSIPSGTIMTSSDGEPFDSTALASSDVFGEVTASSIDPDADVAGVIEFGISGMTLLFSNPITIVIPVDTSLNGETLSLQRSPDGGVTWTSEGITESADDTCTDGVGSNPASEADVIDGTITVNTCRASYFATYSVASSDSPAGSSGGSGIVSTPNACTAVTYSEWTACTNSYKVRTIASRTPANCTLTVAQQLAAQEFCGTAPLVVTPVGVETQVGVEAPMGAEAVKGVMDTERALVKKANKALTSRLSGRILLQVEEKGQAWYLEPLSQNRFFMGRPADAYDMMRRFGLGISETNFAKFQSSGVPARFSGRIFLRVGKNGEAYYVNPVDRKMYYLGRAADAFKIMRELALGINNTNIRQIAVGK